MISVWRGRPPARATSRDHAVGRSGYGSCDAKVERAHVFDGTRAAVFQGRFAAQADAVTPGQSNETLAELFLQRVHGGAADDLQKLSGIGTVKRFGAGRVCAGAAPADKQLFATAHRQHDRAFYPQANFPHLRQQRRRQPDEQRS